MTSTPSRGLQAVTRDTKLTFSRHWSRRWYLGNPPTTVFDVTNGYEMAFVACAVFNVIALVLLAFLRFPQGR